MHFLFCFVARGIDVLARIEQEDSELSDLSDGDAEEFHKSSSSSSSSSSEQDNDVDSDEDVPLSTFTDLSKKWTTKRSFSPKISDYVVVDDDPHARAEWSSMDYFKQYIDTEFLEMMSSCTNVNSTVATGRSLNTCVTEIEHFLGASIVMSAIPYPRVNMFWQNNYRVQSIADVITRKRFFKIRSNLKVVIDSDVTDEVRKADRFWKVRPLLDRVRRGCLAQSRCRDVSIDEQMIPFTGASPARRYVPNKPNPIGLKNFVLANPQGLVLDFVVDQGVSSYHPVPNLGVGALVIAHLCEGLTAGTHVYCDRYFTSISLIEYMLQKGVYISGTIMRNRIPAVVRQLSNVRELAKRGRGACEMIVRNDGRIAIVTWFDRKPILIASAAHGIEQLDKCRRWDKRTKSYIEVERPEIIRQYNSKMGGVDLCDRMLSYYRMKTRTRKWTIRTILHFFDLCVINSWIQYREDCRQLKTARKDIQDSLAFRMDIGEKFLSATVQTDSSDSDAPPPPTKRRKSKTPSEYRRFSGAKHLPAIDNVKNAVRCKNSGCSKKTKFHCISCDVHLCLVADRNCFQDYHTTV